MNHAAFDVRKWAAGLAGIVIAVAIWQILTVTKVLDPVAVPSASETLTTLGPSLETGRLWAGVGQTLEGTAIGFALGAAGGVLLGTVIGLGNIAYRSSFLVIEFLKTIPVIAVLPLAVLLFGTTLQMKVLLVTFGVFFPILMQTIYGVRSVDPVVRDTGRVFGLGVWAQFRSITLPTAAPYIATGLRLAAAAALLLDVLSEIVAGGSGIGLQIMQGQEGGDIAYTYANIVIVGILGVILVVGLMTLERRLLAWHEIYRDR
ncbi:MAG TPA: ABC transporter permease [Trebonia sp.]|jgi:ABC-type nitrate/sulfonate/bicarbonate transport system permease component|nr:ABC transporter permease [Trebonia sp.]